MISIKKIDSAEDARKCDNLLTELVMSERKYDLNVKDTFKVNAYYTEIYGKEYCIILGAFDGVEIIGFIYGFLKQEKGELVYDNVGFIDALYVKDDYRNRGVASNLIQEFYKWCDSKDIKYIEVGSYVNNKEAFNLYQKNGFEVVTYFMRKKV